MIRILFIVLISFCFLQKAYSQNISTRIIPLPKPLNNNVLNITKGDDGFFWLRNSQGFWLYDGTGAQLFDITKFRLGANELWQLFTSFDNFLLLTDAKGNLHVYDELNDSSYNFPLGISTVQNIIHTHYNTLLFFNTDGQGFTFSRKKMLQPGPDISRLKGWQKGMRVFASTIDSANERLYLYLGSAVAYVQGDSLITADTYNGKKADAKYRFTTNKGFDITSHYLVLNHTHGFLLYDKNTLKLLYEYNGQDIAGHVVANDKLVLLANKKSALTTLGNGQAFFIVEPPLLDDEFTFYDIIPSGYKDRFLAAGDMGLYELTFNEQKKDSFYNEKVLAHAFAHKSIRGICRVNNNLYVGSYSGFYSYNGKEVKKISPHLVYSIASYDRQTLLLGIENADGLVVYNTVTQSINIPFKGSKLNAIRCFYNYNGLQWGGADNSIYQFYYGQNQWNKKLWFSDTSLGAVRQMAADGSNWYLASQNGFFKLDKNKSLEKVYPRNKSLIIYAFVPYKDGFILGTQSNGLVYISKDGHVLATYSVNEGLAGNYAYSLVKTGHLLVAGTSGGLSVFSLQGVTLKPVPLEEADNAGLLAQECNHGAYFDDTVSKKVILGGLHGLMFVDKRYYTLHANDKPGKLELSYIKYVDNLSDSPNINLFAYCAPAIVIPPNQAYITLKFSSPLNTQHAHGLVRIRGISDKWQSFEAGDEVNMINLPPGKYTLEARLAETAESQYTFTKELIIMPAFYQTLWFRFVLWGAALLLVVLITYSFWRGKVRRLRAEQQLRATIASDLHDDIGSTLNSISVYTQIAGRHLEPGNEKANVILEKIGLASRHMIDTMSDIVWTINPKNDDFENIGKKIYFFAGELLSGKNIQLEFELDERVKKLKLTMQERKNIYLMCKEVINNIYKYSEATTVTIKFLKNGNYLEVYISDNGKGFNNDEKVNRGNGLTNIQARAAEIGAKAEINSIPGVSTKFLLRLKAV